MARRLRLPSPRAAGLLCAVAFALLTSAAAGAAGGGGSPAHVIVLLSRPPADRAAVAAEQLAFTRALAARVPEAHVRWRYSLTLNGLSVVVPRGGVPVLERLPGVRTVVPSIAYGRARTTRTVRVSAAARASGPRQIGAPSLWGTGLATAGQGMKIGIIDTGVDQKHAYFKPAGYTMPEGFPKGQVAYTTAKVIVARAFPPPGAKWKHASKPFDPTDDHGTHVAGIAAGNSGTRATGGQVLSGVAPFAYIGNYKVYTVPTDSGVGLDGNAPEIVAGIEAAVADGMDVINLSIGEPEIEPTRDVVALALDAAASAGVVPVVAAGNDFTSFGRGSVSSPGNSAGAITVGSVTNVEFDATPAISDFSSAGPTPISLRLKPDVSAPGSGILSSVPGGWRALSGTSMAAPHVAGAAALLAGRHPEWSVAQLKSALISTGRPVQNAESTAQAPPTRSGGGAVDLPAAVQPLVLSEPASLSFGLVEPDRSLPATIVLTDAGGGAGTWSVTTEVVDTASKAMLTAPASVTVPGTLPVMLSTAGTTPEEVSGYVRLERDGAVRRIPFWGRVFRPQLGSGAVLPLRAPGEYRGDTRLGEARVSRYFYPEVPTDGRFQTDLRGPELVYRVKLSRPVANFGVVIVSRARGTKVEPRVVVAGNEARLTGYAGLPFNLNPYLTTFEDATLSAGALSPVAGEYDVVFDSPSAATAGTFTFRFWIDDTTPPAATLTSDTVVRDKPLRIRVNDAGSGIDPKSISVEIGRSTRTFTLRGRELRIPTTGLKPGKHRLRLQLSDHQETRNMENVARILPNTRVLETTFAVQR